MERTSALRSLHKDRIPFTLSSPEVITTTRKIALRVTGLVTGCGTGLDRSISLEAKRHAIVVLRVKPWRGRSSLNYVIPNIQVEPRWSDRVHSKLFIHGPEGIRTLGLPIISRVL